MENQPIKKINLNTASQADLITLPGIGPELAQEIIGDRKKQGIFKDTSDVMRVKGIGKKLYEQIREYIFVAAAEGEVEVEPIIFRGVASNLKGVIAIENRADQPIRRLKLRVEQCNLLTYRGDPIKEINISRRLQPGQLGKAVVSLALDRSTPPGIHRGELVLEGERRPIIFHIAEILKVNVSPKELIIEIVPGSKVDRTVFVTNSGNVPITIDDIGSVGIEETGMVDRALRNTIGKFKGGGVDAMVDTFTGQLKEGLTRSRVLVIRTKKKPVKIPPGKMQSLELEITLPKTMPTTYNYHGYIQLYNSRINLVLVTPQKQIR